MFWKKKEPQLADFLDFVPPPFPPSPVADLRPCLVDDKPAVFHRWVDVDQGILEVGVLMRETELRHTMEVFRDCGYAPAGCSAKVLRSTLALVEYPDGSVGQVKPELVQFLDRGDDSMG